MGKPSMARNSCGSESIAVADVPNTSMRIEEQAYSWWQNTIASPFQKMSEDIENGFNRMISSIQEGDNEDEDEDEDDEDEQEDEEEEHEEEKEGNKEKIA